MNFKQSPQVHRIKNFTYMEQNMIGKGAAGKVYKGINQQTGQQVAIKIMEMSEIDNEVTQYLLQCQKQSLTSISNDYVLRAYEILQTQEQCLIITPLCSGGTLKQYIKSKCKLLEAEALHIFVKLLRGYLAIRDKGFIHRDLKSSNIMFRNGEPVIIDFGYCEKTKGKKPKIFYNVGSPSYMSPQAYYKTMYSEKSDLWALGIILYEMLEGYTIDHGQPIDRYFASLTKNGVAFRAKISEETKKLVRFILSPNPHARPSVDQVIQIVERAIFQGNQMQSMNGKGNQYQQRHQQQPYQSGKISLKQSRKNQPASQKLIPFRETMAVPQQQSQPQIQIQQVQQGQQVQQVVDQKIVNVNNQQVLVNSNPMIMFQQNPVQGFDKNMVKMSQSVYRPQPQAFQQVAQRPQSTKTIPQSQPQMKVNVMPQQFPIFTQQQFPQFQHHHQHHHHQHQQQQMILFQNRPSQQTQAQQPQPQPQLKPKPLQSQSQLQIQPKIKINEVQPQYMQLIDQSNNGHTRKQSNHILQQLNPLRTGQVYQSLIQNPTQNFNQQSMMDNNKNLRVCHSKIFNDGHSVLTIQHNDNMHNDWLLPPYQQMNMLNQQQQQAQLTQNRNMLINALMTNSVHQNDFNIASRQSIGSTTSSLSGQSNHDNKQMNMNIQNMNMNMNAIASSSRQYNPVVQSLIVQPSPRMSVQAYPNTNTNINTSNNGNQMGMHTSYDGRSQVFRSMIVPQTFQQLYPQPQHQQPTHKQQQMIYINNHIPQPQHQQQQQFVNIPMTTSVPVYQQVPLQQQAYPTINSNMNMNNQFKEVSPRRYFNTESDYYPINIHANTHKYIKNIPKHNSRPLSPVAQERASMPINHTNTNMNTNMNMNMNGVPQQQQQQQQGTFFLERPLANNTNINVNVERNFLKKTQPYFHMNNNKQNFMIPTNQKPNQEHKQTKNTQRPISEYPKFSNHNTHQVQSQPLFKGHHLQPFCRPIQTNNMQGQKLQRASVNQKIAPPMYF